MLGKCLTCIFWFVWASPLTISKSTVAALSALWSFVFSLNSGDCVRHDGSHGPVTLAAEELCVGPEAASRLLQKTKDAHWGSTSSSRQMCEYKKRNSTSEGSAGKVSGSYFYFWGCPKWKIKLTHHVILQHEIQGGFSLEGKILTVSLEEKLIY